MFSLYGGAAFAEVGVPMQNALKLLPPYSALAVSVSPIFLHASGPVIFMCKPQHEIKKISHYKTT